MNRRFILKAFSASALTAILPLANAARAATVHEVTIKGFAFTPNALTVQVGDTIKFTNLDGAPHTATARNDSFNTGTLRKNKSADIHVTADMSGEFFCKFHPNMTGKLTLAS